MRAARVLLGLATALIAGAVALLELGATATDAADAGLLLAAVLIGAAIVLLGRDA